MHRSSDAETTGMMLKLLVGALVVGVAHCFSHQNLGLRSAFSRGHLQLSQASPRRFRLAAGRTTNARAVGMMLWGFLPPQKAPREPEPEPTIVEVNNEAELETMLFSGTMTDKLVVVDWYASWCKVCFFLEPRFKKLAREYIDKAIFVKLDAIVLEYNDGKAGPSNLKSKCGVTKYPTFQIWKQGTLVDEIIGAQDFKPKDFERTLRGLLDEWEGKYVKPLRVSGIGTTKEAYEQQKRGDGGGGGGGGWRRGGGDGNGSRSLGE